MLSPAHARQLTLLGLIALIITYSLHYLLLLPQTNVLLWCIKIIPMLLCLPGVVRDHVRTFQWMGFLLMLYFIDGILNIFSLTDTDTTLYVGIAITFFSLLLYCSTIVFVRSYKKEKLQTGRPPAADQE
ncbi:MAG: DUF2069 domain-containing protein [Natronospirillum sp.]